MKFKSLALVFCLSLFSSAFATTMHANPNADGADQKTIKNQTMYPGYCEIEIVNRSFSDLRVYGTFDDGSTIDFPIYSYEGPHYISLFYYFYCHNGMYLTIQSPYYTVYSGWTDVNTTVTLVPYFNNNKQIKAELVTR